MKDDRRDFIKKSTSVAASLSLGTIGVTAAGIHKQKGNDVIFSIENKAKIDYIKDAGMELYIAYFAGKEPRKIEL